MSTTPQLKRVRLRNEFADMVKLGERCPWMKVEFTQGNPPLITEYLLTINVNSFVDRNFRIRKVHEVICKLPATYPDAPPEITMKSRPEPYHPNWWGDGRWCAGPNWDPETDLVVHLIRMVRTLVFDLEVSNPESVTDADKASWFLTHRKSGKFPTMNLRLPDLSDGSNDNDYFKPI